ncbi:transposable element Tcb1 transposase [Trichonephila clavipes]|nr:transposable element Tcb1 transposase [Trichonephila clavipes]
MHRHSDPEPGIMVLGGVGYHFRISLVRIARTLNSQHYISKVLEPVAISYLQGLLIELLPFLARSPDLSPIENMWSLIAQRLIQITPPAVTPDQLWQRVEAALSAVPQEHFYSLFESMPMRVAMLNSKKGGYTGC